MSSASLVPVADEDRLVKDGENELFFKEVEKFREEARIRKARKGAEEFDEALLILARRKYSMTNGDVHGLSDPKRKVLERLLVEKANKFKKWFLISWGAFNAIFTLGIFGSLAIWPWELVIFILFAMFCLNIPFLIQGIENNYLKLVRYKEDRSLIEGLKADEENTA